MRFFSQIFHIIRVDLPCQAVNRPFLRIRVCHGLADIAVLILHRIGKTIFRHFFQGLERFFHHANMGLIHIESSPAVVQDRFLVDQIGGGDHISRLPARLRETRIALRIHIADIEDIQRDHCRHGIRIFAQRFHQPGRNIPVPGIKRPQSIQCLLIDGDNPDIGTGARRPLVQRIRQHLVNRIQRLEKTKQKCDNSHCQSSQPDRQIPFHFIPPSSSSKER